MEKKKSRYINYRIMWFWIVFSVLHILLSFVIIRFAYSKSVVFFTGVALAGLLILAWVVAYKYIYVPYRNTGKLLKLFVTGFTIQDTFNLRYPLSAEMDAAIEKVHDIIMTKELLNASKRQAQYLALQNQINPHFLYNTLEGIRSDAIIAGMDNIANMTEALARFFRYNISNLENLVTLEEEIQNAENYFMIQQYRFGDRIRMEIEYDEAEKDEIMQCRLLKLTLQPIVENAIIHGLERKLSDGLLKIRLELTAARLLITVSDNGIGMHEDQLEKLNAHLNAAYFDSGHWENTSHGGIALINVNNRIKLLYGEEYGLYIYSIKDKGTDVQITLPRMIDEKMLRHLEAD
ncbi:MAG TPA: histidine kinase [Clostridiaceae bacterium]|jgi:two-component system sensor histidine kinase YesM|nr:histidine kinase [Clostridiaceae bacterium]